MLTYRREITKAIVDLYRPQTLRVFRRSCMSFNIHNMFDLKFMNENPPLLLTVSFLSDRCFFSPWRPEFLYWLHSFRRILLYCKHLGYGDLTAEKRIHMWWFWAGKFWKRVIFKFPKLMTKIEDAVFLMRFIQWQVSTKRSYSNHWFLWSRYHIQSTPFRWCRKHM